MDDSSIIELYFSRSESAISETSKKYGKYCYYIAHNILLDDGESEECVNDTFFSAWNAIPPKRPSVLRTFLGKITRNISLNRIYERTAAKRGNGESEVFLEELGECVPSANSVQKTVDDNELIAVIDGFLGTLDRENRKIFMRRYWFMSSIKEIAKDYNLSESKVKMSLFRTRRKLKNLLESEGVEL